MGKKKNKEIKIKPFVSICTPTFNRRPFIPFLIKCIESQDYPHERMEWIIIDDGSDKIEDLINEIKNNKFNIKYFKLDHKLSLGEKRNLMHEKSIGEFLVYMDDDDFYPSQRVSHAITMLETHPSALCAGSSEIYIYFKHIEKMYQFGPYGDKHATAGTFAFRRKLLQNHRYNNNAALAEEKEFLNNYTVPFVQLDPMKVILVVSHEHNTFDKKKLLINPDPRYCKESEKTISDFIKNKEMKDFYHNNVHECLKNYPLGLPVQKPDVLKQIKELEEEREKQLMMQNQKNSICYSNNGENIELTSQQIIDILHKQQNEIEKLNKELNIKNRLLQALQERLKLNI